MVRDTSKTAKLTKKVITVVTSFIALFCKNDNFTVI